MLHGQQNIKKSRHYFELGSDRINSHLCNSPFVKYNIAFYSELATGVFKQTTALIVLWNGVQIVMGKKKECLDCLDSVITNGARCAREISSRTAMAKAAFNKEQNLHQQVGDKVKEETGEVQRLEHGFVWR